MQSTSIKHIAASLNVGDSVSLYYSVVLGRTAKRLWWPGTVCKAVYETDERGVKLYMSVRFVAMFGIEQSITQFEIKSTDHVCDVNGSKFSWKKDNVCLVQDSEEEDNVCAVEADNIVRTGVKRENEIVDSEGPHVKCVRTEFSTDDLVEMQDTVNKLERTVQTIQNQLSSIDSTRILEDISPMQRRLSVYVKKFLCRGFVSRSSMKIEQDGMGVIKQHLFTTSADCSLGQYDSLIWDIDEKYDVSFQPDLPTFKRTPRDCSKATFRSAYEFMDFFGVVGSTVDKNIILSKVKEGELVASEVLGSILRDVSDESKPVLISIACNVQQWNAERKYFFRQSSRWNTAESSYIHSLQNCDEQKWAETLKIIDVEDIDSLRFGLTWESIHDKDITCLPSRRSDILGTLTANIPYLSIRDGKICDSLQMALRDSVVPRYS